MSAASVPSVAVVVGPAIQAVEPSITRHVIVPEYVFPDPSAGLIRDHSPTGSPASNWAATVSRRGGRVPYTYDPATNSADSDGEGDNTGLGGEGEGAEDEGAGERSERWLALRLCVDGGGVASARPPTSKGTPNTPMSRIAARPSTRRPSMRRRPVVSSSTRARTRGETGAAPSSACNRSLSRRMPAAIDRHRETFGKMRREFVLFRWREWLAELLGCQENEALVIRHGSASLLGARISRSRTRARQM